MAWIAVAIAGGVATAAGKSIAANQTKQRNKGYINDSFRRSSQKLGTEQASAREGSAESLNARGLAQGGTVSSSPIHAAMMDGLMKSTGNPNTVGGQVQSDMGVQMGLETQDLEQQHDRATKENKVGYVNSLIDAGASGIQTGVNLYTGGKDLSAMKGGASGAAPGTPNIGALPGVANTPTAAPPSVSRDSIHAAMLSGSSAFGVHPNDPLGEETSAWYTGAKPKSLLASPDQSNASFTTGG